MTGRISLLAVLAVSALLTACSGTAEAPAQRTDAVIGGRSEAALSSVLALTLVSDPYSLCSAVLIAPNLVLTARHCVAASPELVDCASSEFGPSKSGSDVIVAADALLDSSTPWYRSAEVRTPSDPAVCGQDIALVRLSGRIPGSIAKPLIPRIDVPPRAGELYSVVGYGITAPGDVGSAGVRRIRDDVQVLCRGFGCSGGVLPAEFALAQGTCSGDSGGPAIDEQGRVVGVTARGDVDCVIGIDSDVSSRSAWIRDAANDAASAAGYPAPYWAVTGSSDPPPDAGAPEVDAGPDPAPDTTTRDGGVAPAPLPTASIERPCTGSGDCHANEACYSETKKPPGTCVSICSADLPCAEELRCDSALHVCLPRSDEIPSTCAVASSHPGSPSRGGLAFVSLAFGLAVATVRSSRRRRRARSP
jgi:hypothetical protein